jgi:membrane-associated phospholipid phosphatase
MPRTRHWLIFATASAILTTPAFARDEKAWGHASSYTRDALIVVALGLPALRDDWQGTLQAGESVGAAFLIKTGLKEAFPEMRPDGSGNKSFPSGHSAMAFAAAASIQNREGWKAGLIAQLAATFVGVSRVQARKHHWYDVVVGAAIGEGSGFLLTSKRDGNVRVLPWGDTGGAGLAVAARF